LHDGVPMLGERTIIPRKLRPRVLATLHSAHQGTYGMMLRASETCYWPGFANDISKTRSNCQTCHSIAPSQSNLPPVDPVIPEYPFQHIALDHFSLNNNSYGVFVDRFTNWPGVYIGDGSMDVCKVLAKLSEDYGIPETITTDGAKNYVSDTVKQFMKQYGIQHRVSSVGNPHANCRAEVGVRSMKRMIRDNVSITGKLDTAKFSRAILQYRNTKDRDTGKSPAEFLMGRQLRDFMPRSKEQLMGWTWHHLAAQREAALAVRGAKLKERLSENVKKLPPLMVGDDVIVQNQTGNKPLRWDKTGTVVKVNGFDQYEVRTDGSRKITLRNRKFLRKIDKPKVRILKNLTDIQPEEENINDNFIPAPGIVTQPSSLPPNIPPPEPEQVHDDNETFFTPEQSPRKNISDANNQIRNSQNQRRFNERMDEVDDNPESTVDQEVQSVPENANPDPQVLSPPPLPRRSERVNKGKTSRFDDYVQFFEATATMKPRKESFLDSVGEDVTEYKTTGQKQSRGSTNNIVAAAVAAFEKRLK